MEERKRWEEGIFFLKFSPAPLIFYIVLGGIWLLCVKVSIFCGVYIWIGIFGIPVSILFSIGLLSQGVPVFRKLKREQRGTEGFPLAFALSGLGLVMPFLLMLLDQIF